MYKALAFLTLFCVCGLQAPYVRAAYSEDSAGTASVQVLKLGAGARAAGMGDAFTALSDDASAVYWNPGGLAGTKKQSASLMHNILFEGISYDWLAYVLPLKTGAVGAGIQRLSYGSIAAMDETGLETGSFSPSETVGTVSYGVGYENFGFGASLKYISGKIERSAAAFAADIGVKYGVLNEEGLLLGLALQNMGGKMKYVSQADPLPLNFKIGAAYRTQYSWVISADADMPSDNALSVSLGGEYSVITDDELTVSGRAGYSSRTKDLDGLAGFTVGAGGSYEGIGLDYAFVPFGSLGNSHKISVSLEF